MPIHTIIYYCNSDQSHYTLIFFLSSFYFSFLLFLLTPHISQIMFENEFNVLVYVLFSSKMGLARVDKQSQQFSVLPESVCVPFCVQAVVVPFVGAQLLHGRLLQQLVAHVCGECAAVFGRKPLFPRVHVHALLDEQVTFLVGLLDEIHVFLLGVQPDC